MNLLFSIATIVSTGLMIGTEFAVWAFINPILEQLDEQPRRDAIRLFAGTLGRVMPFWYGGNFALLLTEAFLARGDAVGLLGTASGIWAAVIVLTLIFLVPINNRLSRQNTGLSPDQERDQHQRWDVLLRARVVALVGAFVLSLVGLHG